MLEVQEILELERRWRAYDKGRKGSKCNKDKKYQTYMLVALLATSIATASFVFFYLEDTSVNVASKATTQHIQDDKNKIYNETIHNQTQNLPLQNLEQSQIEQNTANEGVDSKNTTNAIENENLSVEHLAVDNTQKDSVNDMDIQASLQEETTTNIRQQVLFKAPTEETINLGMESVGLKNSSNDLQKGFKFEIQSSSNADISVDDLKTKFDKSNSSDLAVLIAKKYYDIQDYKSSEKWALIANELNSENEESWVIFAKSKYNLGQKYDAVKVLRIYNEKANSKDIENLIKHIENNAI